MIMKYTFRFTFLFIAMATLFACNDQQSAQTTETTTAAKQPGVKEVDIVFGGDNASLKGFVAFDSSSDAKRPAILIVPEWWGLNDYPKMRARELAKLGYIALAMDMYGEGVTTDSPSVAGKLATPFYTNPQKALARIQAALASLKTFGQTDTGKIAASG
jgi:dienelactone hydrolase